MLFRARRRFRLREIVLTCAAGRAGAVSDGGQRSGAISVSAVLLAVAPIAMATAMLTSSRTLVSWDGFLHVSIAERIALGGWPPENPFFAGEPLPHPWLHDALAAALARTLAIDMLHALALLTLLGLAVLCYAALRIGARQLGSAGAGLLIAWLALVGQNPLGPAIAAHRALKQGVPLLEFPPVPVETVFVSDESAELFMAHPLLGALQLSGDWRLGPNLPWFLDNSPRAAALALLMPLLALMLAPRSPRAPAGGFALGALGAALDPHVGLSGAGALLLGAALAACAPIAARTRRSPGVPVAAPKVPLASTGLGVAAAAFIGALAAAPSYVQLFAGAEGSPALRGFDGAVARDVAATALSFCALAPLACYGALRASERSRPRLAAIALGGVALAAVSPLIELGDRHGHSLASVAGVLLAVPALGFVSGRRLRLLAAAELLALFLPMTLCTLASFAGRPPLPIARDGEVLVRIPDDDPLARLYGWVRSATPPDAVFVVDAGHPVKMATNVSELPAFTGRALFVDQPSSLAASYATFEERRELAAALAAGDAPSAAEHASLAWLARPVYLVSHAADDEHLAARLEQLWGAPLFVAEFVAVYPIVAAS